MINLFQIYQNYRKWKAKHFLKELRKRLLKLNNILKNAGYTRRERRSITQHILKDIEESVNTLLRFN